MNQPTTITETEGDWARAAAYALDHLGDPNTFTSETMEHIPASEILFNAAARMRARTTTREFYDLLYSIVGMPRKD